jgi:crotonobetainyl-CoA:carnitine CoA-transferase CaiB-like acyl-CoA transferase
MNAHETPADYRSPKGPLAGIRVLDLTATLMGPYCTQILCDMGAEVIKVESPAGDTTRYLPDGRKPGMSGMFINLNRGKRSIVLDLKSFGGCEVLSRLVRASDVFVHSMRFEAIKRLSFSYEQVKHLRADIVYANLYGYSRDGPYAHWAAYDDTIQGISGLAMLQAEATGEPRYVPTVMADKVAGLTAAYAIAMALFHRARTGEGQEIEIPMFETMVSFLLAEHIGGSLFDPPIADPTYRRAVSPHRRPYRTADGYISVLIYNDKQWNRFVAIAGAPAELCDARFGTLETRAQHIDDVYAAIGEVMPTRQTSEWMQRLQEAGIPAVPLKSLKELMSDPHLEQTGFFVRQQTKEGQLRFPGIPTRFSKTPGEIREAGPQLGEHTVSIMKEAGFTDAEVESHLKAGSAGTTQAVSEHHSGPAIVY